MRHVRRVDRGRLGISLVAAAALATGAVAGAASRDTVPAVRPDDAPAATVSMNDALDFVPDTIAITAGETIEWTNDSKTIHTVTADPEKVVNEKNVALPEGAEAFDSGILRPDESFSHTFEVPGEYRYFCIPHEAAGMVGVVRVEPADGSAKATNRSG